MKIGILLNALVHLLPTLSRARGTKTPKNQDSSNGADQQQQQQQYPIGVKYTDHGEVHAMGPWHNPISTVSWGANRLDIFGLTGNTLTHKFWAGDQWIPSSTESETLGKGLDTPPVATTWGPNRLDIFGLDDNGVLKHQYWDGTAWQPNVAEFENLGDGCDTGYSIAATTWGENRLDLVCTGLGGDLLHQYYDGSQWQPEAGKMESLGVQTRSSPKVVSWGENRLDIFVVDSAGPASVVVLHKYWDGTKWSEWENFYCPFNLRDHEITVTSWGKDRLDVYGVSVAGQLVHLYWDGTQWQGWEILSGEEGPRLEVVAAVSWSPNRHDIVARDGDLHYWYKYWDGTAWKPDAKGWYSKGEEWFASSPSVISWGENRLDIFGLRSGVLLHQAWVGTEWYPNDTSWETLGKTVLGVAALEEDLTHVGGSELRK